MKITLYLNEKIITFNLPTQISGSFSFDEKEHEERKLINIEATPEGWMLYSTPFSKIVTNIIEDHILVTPGAFYVLEREGIKYLIRIASMFDDSYQAYDYSKNLLLKFGGKNATIDYQLSLMSNLEVTISYKEDGNLYVEKNGSGNIYVNEKAVKGALKKIDVGDKVEIYGLKLFFLNSVLIMNNPNFSVSINLISSNLTKKEYGVTQDDKDKTEVPNIDMYKPEDYYSKSPRIRRQIETKTFKIENPPEEKTPTEDMPILLTLGPSFAMLLMSVSRLTTTINALALNQTTFKESWTSLLTGTSMLLSALVWPNITKSYKKHLNKVKLRREKEHYEKYILEKADALDKECMVQAEILKENLFDELECLNIMNRKGMNFWDKRMDQNDFLVARVGVGDEKLDANIEFSEREYDLDKTYLRVQAEEIVANHKIIKNVPIGYSFFKNKTTAIMGLKEKTHGLINNIILQFSIFYSYDDLKIVMFTDKEGKLDFEYLKYLNHSLSNDKSKRFFSCDQYSSKLTADYLSDEIKKRISPEDNARPKLTPYYIIIIDGYDLVRKYKFLEFLTEIQDNIGFSVIILENRLNKLPSKCTNFILLGDNTSSIVTNSYDNQDIKEFKDVINYDINMMSVAQVLSNVPVEIMTETGGLPNSITFLEMEKVGKVEQLNILERWHNNDSTESLQAEIGVGTNGDLIYLDLHEKFHGPHGLVAGTTGSGKSEFIITYILSMAINYSPNDIAFILIDYKGGGLAYAFENKKTGAILPHLAGTITNLDKSEMDRTLVSIDSEVKRRQMLFNEARDATGESTIDIYKYQKHFHNGELIEPCPHLFIICDEFAELKSQQPEFMDDLISIARIGRSLGVHLILATQKPTGQVNEQIWTNTKFRVCLKVQSPGDSREMLKKPDAAFIKEAGRFYLQVGQDEIYELGQSGWAGAKYYPSNTVIKEADKSINLINDSGIIVKSIKAGTEQKAEAQGEQLAAILKNIIDIANTNQVKATRLWLDNIPGMILVDELMKKYSIVPSKYNVKAIIGEYDAPEIQQQGLLELSLLEQENVLFFGNEEAEREHMIKTLVYSICQNHSAEEINFYILDFGSESMGVLNGYPQVGEVAFGEEDEKFKNTLKLIKEELNNRKKDFMNYGGDYKSYLKNSSTKVPAIVLIINNFEALQEIQKMFNETLLPIVRECARYGIYIWITLTNTTSLTRRVIQCFKTTYSLHYKDASLYRVAVPGKSKIIPRGDFARGLVNNNGVHEFQTASIVEDSSELIMYLKNNAATIQDKFSVKAKEIAKLPDKVDYEYIKDSVKSLEKVPIGVEKESLEIAKFNFTTNPSTTITGFKLENISQFILDITAIFKALSDVSTIFIDAKKQLEPVKNIVNNYFFENLDKSIEMILDYLKKYKDDTSLQEKNGKILIIIYGLSALKESLTKTDKIDQIFKEVKKNENIRVIICEGSRVLKTMETELWYSQIKNNTDGIWIGKGFQEQGIFRVMGTPRDASKSISDKYGFNVVDQTPVFIKTIDFKTEELEEDKDEE